MEQQALQPAIHPAGRRITAALGLFDGVHLGHRSVIAEAVSCGACHAVTFAAETMPQKQGHPVRYIYHDELKRRLLLQCGAEAVLALPFGEIAEMDGAQYCREILCEQLHVSTVVAGADYRFGHGAACGADDLIRFGKQFGFDVRIVPQVCDADAVPVSSSHIRTLLESGQIENANFLLGTDYQILAPVVTGNHIGSTVLSVPTANQTFEPWQCIPRNGVYASFAAYNGEMIPSITNIGVRPTVTGGNAEPIAETHLIGWSGELVGKLLPVTLCGFLRPEQPFVSLAARSVQLQADIRTRMRLLPSKGSSGTA